MKLPLVRTSKPKKETKHDIRRVGKEGRGCSEIVSLAETESGVRTRKRHLRKGSQSSGPKKEVENDSSDESGGEVEVTLAEAAAFGCKKCEKELKTGEKTRNAHAEDCPRKRVGRGGLGVMKVSGQEDSKEEDVVKR